MTATESKELTLGGTAGFVVESSEGDLGWVEEVWVGDANEPRAVAVRTTQGRRGLLLGEDVLAVDREYHWVVVPPSPRLLELDAPRLVTVDDEEGAAGRIEASWATTGEVFRASPRRRRWRFRLRRRTASAATGQEPRLWKAVALLLSSIALIVVVVALLAFLIARLVTGAAY